MNQKGKQLAILGVILQFGRVVGLVGTIIGMVRAVGKALYDLYGALQLHSVRREFFSQRLTPITCEPRDRKRRMQKTERHSPRVLSLLPHMDPWD